MPDLNLESNPAITTPPSLPNTDPKALTTTDGRIHVALTHAPLDVTAAYASVKHPDAGAVVVFAGTTRRSTPALPSVPPTKALSYTSYAPLALRTLRSVAASALETHALHRISIQHRLGRCPVGEESVLVCVSAAHRRAAFEGGEEALERVKQRVEVWKWEEWEGEERGVWKANVEDQRRRMKEGSDAGNGTKEGDVEDRSPVELSGG